MGRFPRDFARAIDMGEDAIAGFDELAELSERDQAVARRLLDLNAESGRLAEALQRDTTRGLSLARVGIQTVLVALRDLGHPELVPPVALAAQGAIAEMVADHKARATAETAALGNQREAL